MRSFKQYLNEVFDKPLKFKWEVKSKDFWLGRFFVPLKNPDFEPLNVELNLDLVNRPTITSSGKIWEVIFSVDGEIDLSSAAGNEIKIFSTVFAMVKEWIKKQKPKIIFFSAKETSRRRLYQTFVRKFAKPLGYKLVSKIESGDEFNNQLGFLLQRV